MTKEEAIQQMCDIALIVAQEQPQGQYTYIISPDGCTISKEHIETFGGALMRVHPSEIKYLYKLGK